MLLLHKRLIFTWQQALCSLRHDGCDRRRLHESTKQIPKDHKTRRGLLPVVQDCNCFGGSMGDSLASWRGWRKTEAFHGLMLEGSRAGTVWLARKATARRQILAAGSQPAAGERPAQRLAAACGEPAHASCGICCTGCSARAVAG